MERLKNRILEELSGFNGRIGLAIEIEGESFYFNSKEVFQSASVIKIPILIEGLRQSDVGILDLAQVKSVDHRVGGSGVLQALSRDVRMTIKDFMTLMITVSDNTATNLLIDLLGMDELNESMKKMGLRDTVLTRYMMDFAAIERGLDNFTSPMDMILCLKLMDGGSYLSEESRKVALEIMNKQQFQDKLPGMLDLDQVFVANKTGGLPLVEHDCAVFKYNGKTAYAAVLMDQLNDLYVGKYLMSKIGKYIFEYLLELNDSGGP